MIHEGIVSLLAASDVGTSYVGDRIYAVLLPRDTAFPCITYADVSVSRIGSLDGSTITDRRIQFNFWGRTFKEAKSAQEALDSIFGNYVGTLPDGTRIIQVMPGTQQDLYEADSKLYHSISDYLFSY